MCSCMAMASGQGQLGAHLTNIIFRFISEQEQGVVLISNKSFQVGEKVFLSKAAPAFFASECHPCSIFFLWVKHEIFIGLYEINTGIYFYVLIY